MSVELPWLTGEVTSIALCWKLTRPDGVVLGLGGHDRDLFVNGIRYRSSPGMLPSAIGLTNLLAGDSMEIEGALDRSFLTLADFDEGRWRGARAELWACDWSDPDAGVLLLAVGRIGDVQRTAGAGSAHVRIEMLSTSPVVDLPGPPKTSPLCRADLGDERCTVDMAGRTMRVTLAGSEGGELLAAVDVPDGERFVHGRLRILTGPQGGIERRIAAVEGTRISLEEPVWRVEAGSIAELREGCDRRFATCRTRFGNAQAFDAEPHLPGADAMLRYDAG